VTWSLAPPEQPHYSVDLRGQDLCLSGDGARSRCATSFATAPSLDPFLVSLLGNRYGIVFGTRLRSSKGAAEPQLCQALATGTAASNPAS